jgi:gliding motility-associated-like protein
LNYKIHKIFFVLLLLLSSNLFSQKYNLLPDTIGYCLGDTAAKIEIKSHFGNKTIVNWDTPMGRIANARKVKPYKAGKYYVKLSSPQFVKPVYDSTYVRVYTNPSLHLKDTVLCKGKTLALDAKNTGMQYAWSNGETRQKISIANAGRYWIKITNGSCNFTDTVIVKNPEGSLVSINNEYNFCVNDENKLLTLKTGASTKIRWNTGATTATVYATHEGTYWVRTETMGCGVQVDSVKVKLKACECELFIPNSFTPNEDNRNDYFFPVAQCEYTYYLLTVSDRWGNLVFSTNTLNGRWDGRFKGNLCPEDIYVYHIESTEKISEKKKVREGHISLFR